MIETNEIASEFQELDQLHSGPQHTGLNVNITLSGCQILVASQRHKNTSTNTLFCQVGNESAATTV